MLWGTASEPFRRYRIATEGCLQSNRPPRGKPVFGADAAAGRTTYCGEVTFQADLPTAGLKAQLLYEKLVKLGDVYDCRPPLEQLDAIDHLECFRFRLTTDQSADAVRASCDWAECNGSPWSRLPLHRQGKKGTPERHRGRCLPEESCEQTGTVTPSPTRPRRRSRSRLKPRLQRGVPHRHSGPRKPYAWTPIGWIN